MMPPAVVATGHLNATTKAEHVKQCLEKPRVHVLQLGNNGPGAGFSPCITSSGSPSRELREAWGKTRGKESAQDKVFGKQRIGQHSPFCSMTPSVVLLVLYEEAQRVEEEAVVWDYPGDQWPVKVTATGRWGWGTNFWRAGGNAAPFSRGLH